MVCRNSASGETCRGVTGQRKFGRNSKKPEGGSALLLIIVLSFICQGLYAEPRLGMSLGYRNSSYFKHSAELDLHVSDDAYAVGILTGFDDYIRLSAGAYFEPVDTFKVDLGAYYYHAYEPTSGMAHASVTLGQDLRFGAFLFNYRLGLIGGLGYSIYSDDVFPNLSPDVVLEMGFAIGDSFSMLAYLRSASFYETAAQSLPIVGVEGRADIGRHGIFFDTHVVFADYMEGPTILIKDVVATLGYEVEL